MTGATSGIGLALVKQLATSKKWNIHFVGRNAQKSSSTLKLIEELDPEGKHLFWIADLSSVDDTNLLANKIKSHFGNGLDVFVSNAGMYSHKKLLTKEGHERTFMTNMGSAWIISKACLPLLEKSSLGCFVQVASDAHFIARPQEDDPESIHKYQGAIAYANSKLCNIWLAQHWAEKHPHVFCASMHPGGVRTGFAKGSWDLTGLIFWGPLRWMLRTPEKGAETLVYLVNNYENLPSGKYWFDSKEHKSSQLAHDVIKRQHWINYCEQKFG